MICKLWNAAANDTVGGAGHPGAQSKAAKMNAAVLKQYAWAGDSKRERTAALAAIKCTGLVNGIRMGALSGGFRM